MHSDSDNFPDLGIFVTVLYHRDRRIELAGKLEDLESQGYSFRTGFASLIEQRYGVVAQNLL